MGKVVGRVFLVFIIVILITAGVLLGLYNCSSNTPFESARTSALNTAIDALDIKKQINDRLHTRAQELSEQYGVPLQLIEGGIDMLAIDEWEVTNTPNDNEVRDHVNLQLEGSDLKITTYEDPKVISIESTGDINTFGQMITFSVPESAQGVSNILALYDNAEEFGIIDLANAIAGS